MRAELSRKLVDVVSFFRLLVQELLFYNLKYFSIKTKQQFHSRIHNLTKYEWNRLLYIFMLYRSWMPWATKKDSGSKPSCWRSGDACGTLLRRWNFSQTSAIWITQVISCCCLLRTLKSWSPCRELASYWSCMISLLQYEWRFLFPWRRSLVKNLIFLPASLRTSY